MDDGRFCACHKSERMWGAAAAASIQALVATQYYIHTYTHTLTHQKSERTQLLARFFSQPPCFACTGAAEHYSIIIPTTNSTIPYFFQLTKYISEV